MAREKKNAGAGVGRKEAVSGHDLAFGARAQLVPQGGRSQSRVAWKNLIYKLRAAKLVALVALAVGGTSSQALACRDTPVVTTRLDDGTEIGLYLPQRLAETPDWQPGQGEPPLPLVEAIRIGLEWAKAEYAAFDSVDMRDIKLTANVCGISGRRWYYVMNFAPNLGGTTFYGPGAFVAILMDGTVEEPRGVE